MIQAMNFGLEFAIAEATGLEISSGENRVKTCETEYVSKAVIIACGGKPKKLHVSGEEQFAGKGISYCAMCEGAQFRNKSVIVAGGGNSGVTEAMSLSQIGSKVTIVEIMPRLNASAMLLKRLIENGRIEVISGNRIVSVDGESGVRDPCVSSIRKPSASLIGVSTECW